MNAARGRHPATVDAVAAAPVALDLQLRRKRQPQLMERTTPLGGARTGSTEHRRCRRRKSAHRPASPAWLDGAHPEGRLGPFGVAACCRSKCRAVDLGVGPTPDDEPPSSIWRGHGGQHPHGRRLESPPPSRRFGQSARPCQAARHGEYGDTPVQGRAGHPKLLAAEFGQPFASRVLAPLCGVHREFDAVSADGEGGCVDQDEFRTDVWWQRAERKDQQLYRWPPTT